MTSEMICDECGRALEFERLVLGCRMCQSCAEEDPNSYINRSLMANRLNPHCLTEEEIHFVQSFHQVGEGVHTWSRGKGWWDDRDAIVKAAEKVSPELGRYARNLVASSLICLEHSELSEGLEGLRGNQMDDKLPAFTMEEAEAADTIIRIMDRAHARNLRVALAVVLKMRYNHTRAHKHGGKAM